MVFSSPIFIFGFLPVMLVLYYMVPRLMKNVILLAGSLFFYAWGEAFYVLIMLVSILSNYIFGLLISTPSRSLRKAHAVTASLEAELKSSPHVSRLLKDLAADMKFRRSVFLFIGVAVNIGLFTAFKYANFITDNLNVVLGILQVRPIDLSPVHLPLGISFFSFQAISYLVDVYRQETPVQKNLFNLALYISLFPQLIAGPIVRYHDIADQIVRRKHSADLIASGIQRFIFGLSKKMLIANPMGEVADQIFSLPPGDLSSSVSWLGIICYTLQIYFDFSGYSDMAIGLGRMFGFKFLENFNFPYISQSMQEFWRRWHISLSTWFKDYLYIPLGGSRVPPARVYLNLLIVFFLCGLWHGANWNFVVWGLVHGLFLIIERAGLARLLERIWRPARHGYALLVVMLAWVFFRADNLSLALQYFSAMLGVGGPAELYGNTRMFLHNEARMALAAGILLATPVYGFLADSINALLFRNRPEAGWFTLVPKIVLLSGLFLVSIVKISASTYNPFIYFRF